MSNSASTSKSFFSRNVLTAQILFGLVLHYADVASDFGVLQIWWNSDWTLFAIGISAILVYRVLSASLVYHRVGLASAFLQFIDVNVFLQAYHSMNAGELLSGFNKTKMMESFIEASPFAIAQAYDLVSTESTNEWLWGSQIISFLSVTYAVTKGDKAMFIEHSMFSFFFIIRAFFRAFDIAARIIFIILALLIWRWEICAAVFVVEAIILSYFHIKSGAEISFASSWKFIACFITDLHIQTKYTTGYYGIRVLEIAGIIITFFLEDQDKYFELTSACLVSEVMALFILWRISKYMLPPPPLKKDDKGKTIPDCGDYVREKGKSTYMQISGINVLDGMFHLKQDDEAGVLPVPFKNIDFCKVGGRVYSFRDYVMTTNITQGEDNLMQAAEKNNWEEVIQMVQEGSGSIRKRDAVTGLTPFHLASINGELEAMKALLENKADINIQDKDGQTALTHCIKKGKSFEAVKFLIDEGIDIQLTNSRGNSALCIAAWQKQKEVVKLLLERKADPLILNKDGLDPVAFALIPTSEKPEEGDDIANMILSQQKWGKPDIDNKMISSYFESMNHVDSFQSLIERSQGDIHFDWVQNGLTGLLMVVQRDDPIFTKIFLETDADISLGDGEGFTALHLAARDGRDSVMPILLAQSSKDLVNQMNKAKKTAIEYTFEGSDAANLLLRYGATDKPEVKKVKRRGKIPDKVYVKNFDPKLFASDYHNIVSIVVLGSGGVGKSALTLRLISDEFAEEYDPTIEDSYRKQVTIGDRNVLLNVLDTAGQEEYASLQDQWIREGDAFLIVCDLSRPSTVVETKSISERLERIKDRPIYECNVVLVGNKCDLIKEKEESEQQLFEYAEEAKLSYIHTSAKRSINVTEMFAAAVKTMWLQNGEDERVREKKARKKRFSLCGSPSS